MHHLRPSELKVSPLKLASPFDVDVGKAIPDFAARTLLRWGEHCTECAAPACYASCSLYSPTRGLKCRRFENGIELVSGLDDTQPFRFTFRKWGKLEARFDGRAIQADRAMSLEKTQRRLGGLVDWIAPTDRLERRLFRDFEKYMDGAMTTAAGDATLDEFVFVCVNNSSADAELTLSIKSKIPTVRGFYAQTLRMTPGVNTLRVPVSRITAQIALDGDCLVQLIPVNVEDGTEFIVFFGDFIQSKDGAEAAASASPVVAEPEPPAKPASPSLPSGTRKCLIWDLDNTLWKGTLIEDGLDKLVLNAEAVRAIIDLDRRGILQSVASKNNPKEAIEALTHFGLIDYFLYPQISWDPKSGNINRIAKLLNIGVDSLVFIDDQPYERAEVEANAPAVLVLADTVMPELTSLSVFDVPVTAESARRRIMYQEQQQRDIEFEASGGDHGKFIESCRMELKILKLEDENFERVAELAQRTNQLNYAGQRVSVGDLEALMKGQSPKSPYVLSCADKFGDYGIIGFAIYDPASGNVDNFFMSCRVQNKLVDNAFFGFLSDVARAQGKEQLTVTFKSTGRNEPARIALGAMAFAPLDDSDNGLYAIRLDQSVPDRQYVKVINLSQD
jgi:FkbH-like protein